MNNTIHLFQRLKEETISNHLESTKIDKCSGPWLERDAFNKSERRLVISCLTRKIVKDDNPMILDKFLAFKGFRKFQTNVER